MGIDWTTRLAEYVNSCARLEFNPGTYDCLTFTNGAVRAIRGTGWADEIASVRYASILRSPERLRRVYSVETFPELIDRYLTRVDYPVRGSLVAIPTNICPFYALGIAFGSGIITVAEYGTGWADIEAAAIAWGIDPA